MSRQGFTAVLAAAALFVGTGALAASQEQSSPQGARPNPSGSSTGQAVARPSGGGSSGGSTSSTPSSVGSRPGGGFDSSSGDHRASDDSRGRRAVPSAQGARPRDGRPTSGVAVDRFTTPVREDRFLRYYDPFYSYSYYSGRYPYGYYWPGYGYGIGYFYDPWMWGGYDPYYSGGGYRYSYDRHADLGAVRLKVKPTHAQVFVDGYFVGEVDDFDGVFQRLTLESGPHRIEIRAPGHETQHFEVLITPGQTITYKGDLRPE